MKKFFIIFSCILGLAGFSMGAHANGKGLSTGPAATDVTTSDCQALNEDVTINTSSDVEGYVDCPDTYTVAVATCHQAGRKDASDNVNIYAGSSAGGSISAVTTQSSCTTGTATTVAQAASSSS